MGCPTSRRKHPRSLTRRRSWCCSFPIVSSSPDHVVTAHKQLETLSKHTVTLPTSVPTSPQSSRSSGLNYVVGRIDRILSPGRVSPIVDSYPSPCEPLRESPIPAARPRSEEEHNPIIPLPTPSFQPPPSSPPAGSEDFDTRICLRGRKGGGLLLEMNSGVLIENSKVFAGLIRENSDCNAGSVCRIEITEVDNLGIFRETIELMFEDDILTWLYKAGAYRAIAILEVSASIMFKRCIVSCLKYLEAVPWTEEEEDKLRYLFSVFKFDEAPTGDIIERLNMLSTGDSPQNLAGELVQSITNCSESSARNELKLLVKGLLSRSTVYDKDQCDVKKDQIYAICETCLGSLTTLFVEAAVSGSNNSPARGRRMKPLIERISNQVDNLVWLFDILVDRQMAEDFAELWGNQRDLVKLHGTASPMVRYEVSRVSASLFIAMGNRKLYCRSETRAGVLQLWFHPMLLDFGWLQRCKKGMDMKALEESLGQMLLTLPLKHQYPLFMEWFSAFSSRGSECPNLTKFFQVWWRRSFVRVSEAYCIGSRTSVL